MLWDLHIFHILPWATPMNIIPFMNDGGPGPINKIWVCQFYGFLYPTLYESFKIFPCRSKGPQALHYIG